MGNRLAHVVGAVGWWVALVPAACGDDSQPAVTVRVDTEAPGSDCPQGGKAVHVGVDDDRDGVLDDAEIDETTYVCDPEALVRVDQEPDGDNCEFGGVAIQAGPDDDGDGALDDDEVESTTYVCNDVLAALLTRFDDEPAGDNCALGGTAIRAGLDEDADGTLDDAEVLRVEYVCDAPITLTRIDPEPQGANCAGGGAAVHSGADADGDGVLDDAEVTSTEYVCDGVVVGDLVISNATDPGFLAEVTVVTGDVEETCGPGLASISLPSLRLIGGGILINGCSELKLLSLPALTAVGATVDVRNNPLLGAVELGALGAADRLVITRNDSLDEVGLGSLRVVAGTLSLSGPIATLDLGALERVGALVIQDLAAGAVELPQLRNTGPLSITLSDLTSLSAPVLDFVDGNCTISANPNLPSFTLPALDAVAGDIFIRDNDDLATFAMPQLDSLGERLSIRGTALTGLSLPQLRHVPLVEWGATPALTSLGGLAGMQTVELFIMQGDVGVNDLSDLVGLRRVTEIMEINDSTLRRLAAPNLTDANSLDIESNELLQTLELPSLRQANTLALSSSPAAIRLDLPSLAVVWTTLSVVSAPSLPTCRVDELQAQLALPPANVNVFGTDDGGVCN